MRGGGWLFNCDIDCDDANGAVWQTPGEVQDLVLTRDAMTGVATLSWTAPVDLGGNSVVYDTIRSLDPADFETAAECVESDDGVDTMSSDGDPLAPGAVVFYLIRAENDCPGILSQGPLGAGRTARSCP